MGKPGFKVGVIASAHGVRGQVKIHSFSETPEDLLRYGALTDASGKRRFILTRHGAKATQLIASIEGITDRNDAEKLRGTELWADESFQHYDENEFSYADLTGLKAVTQSGEEYGTIINIYNFGAGDVIELELANRKTEMLPFTSAFFGDVDIEAGRIIVIPPDYHEPEGEPEPPEE